MRSIGCAAVLLLFVLSDAAFAAVEPPPIQIFSYRRNFLVVSSDPGAASWIAGEAERFRESVLREFQWKQKWESPLILDMDFSGEESTRAEMRAAVLRRIFRDPPFWLQCGLERYFSGRRDFHPAQLREIKSAGLWLGLDVLLDRTKPWADARWQDVFARESAGLVSFLKKQSPRILSEYRKGNGNPRAIRVLEEDWAQWIDNAPVLVPAAGSAETGAPSSVFLQRRLDGVLRANLRTGDGETLYADSVLDLNSLEPCCRKDLARRKLLAGYGEFVRLSRLDGEHAALAAKYGQCANLVLQRKDFYEMFVALERQRLAHTTDQR